MRYLRAKLLNWMIQGLLKPVSSDEVLQEVNGSLFLGGQPLQENEENGLIDEARTIKKMALFQLFLNGIHNACLKKIAEQSNGWEDIYFGKALLWEHREFEKMVNGIAKREIKVGGQKKQ